jgi:hypothetical protein
MPNPEFAFTRTERAFMLAILYIRLRNALKRYSAAVEANRHDGDPAYIGWLARNILELRVWVQYCSISQEKAMEFCDDGLRDLADINRYGSELAPEQLTVLREEVSSLSPDKGPYQYKLVRQAAKDSGLADLFEANYKPLSKLAHPTALSIMVTLVGASGDSIRMSLVEEATKWAYEAIAKLDSSFLEDEYRKYSFAFDATNVTLPPDQQIRLD